jgi:hypothetical protein
LLFRPQLGEHLVQLWRQHLFGWPRETEVAQFTVPMAKSEHQGGLRTITGYTNHSAVGRAVLLDLDPFAQPRQIPTVATLGDHALQARHKYQPLLGLLDGGRLSDELEVRAFSCEQDFEALSPLVERLIDELNASVPHEIKREQDRW